MVCLTNLRTRFPPMPPKLNRRRAVVVLSRSMQSWPGRHGTRTSATHDSWSWEVSVRSRAGQYWRLEKLKSFDEFLERRFPESRRKAYYLMSIHEQLAAAGQERSEAGRLDEGGGTGEAGAEAGPALRKCNLDAQSPADAEGGVQKGSGKGVDREGRGAIGANLLQGVQEPGSGHRTSDRDGGTDAGFRQIARILSGNDLCRLSSRSKPG